MNELTIRPAGAVSLPDNSQWTERFSIRSETSNRLYIIAKNKKTGQYGCSCMGFRRARDGVRKCKHLQEGCGLSLAQIHGNALPDLRPKHKRLK